MEGRRRRSLPSPSNWAPHSSHQQAQMRRPSAGHAAKRPRTVTDGPLRRARGEVHHAELELGIGETDGLAEIDEVIYLSPRTRQAVALMPEVDWQRELAVVSGLLSKPLPALEVEWRPGG